MARSIKNNYQICTIYALFVIDDHYRYVGQTVLPLKDRLSRHMSAARGSGTSPVLKWINECLGHNQEVKIIELDTTSLALGDICEISWIIDLHDQGHNLLNVLDHKEI